MKINLTALACLAVIICVPVISYSADLVVSGSLVVEGDADIQGDTLSIGTRADSSVTPGLNVLYLDAAAPSIYFSATRNNVAWLWQRDGEKIQMQLGGDNKLQLYDQSIAPVAKITLDPLGSSVFSGPVNFNGGTFFTGSTTFSGAFNASGTVSVSGAFSVLGAAHIFGGAVVDGALVVGSGSIGSDNNFEDGATGFMAGNFNSVGGAIIQDLGDSRYHAIRSDAIGFYIDGDIGDELAGSLRAYFTPAPKSWSMQISNVIYEGGAVTFTIPNLVNANWMALPGDWGVAYYPISMVANAEGALVTIPYDSVVMPENGCVDLLSFMPGDPVWGVTMQLNGSDLSGLSYNGGITRFLLYGSSSSDWWGGGQLMLMMPTRTSSSGSVVYGDNNVVRAVNAQAIGIGNQVLDMWDWGFGDAPSGAYGYNNLVNASGAYAFGANINNQTAQSVQVGVSNEAKITISGAGHLGIGTETPSVGLDVVGDASITGAVHLSGEVTVGGTIRIRPSGDLDMGGFKTGPVPSP